MRKRPHFVNFNGIDRPLKEWAEILGIDYKTIWIRLRNGWSVEQALQTPVIVWPQPYLAKAFLDGGARKT